MATTFTWKDSDYILQPALCQALPLLGGLNQHFPRAMVYGHESHHGLGITHLYNKQGFLHILALMKFSTQKGIMDNLLNHSYEALQVELGLLGNFLVPIFGMVTHNHTLLVKPYLAVFLRIWNPFEHAKKGSPRRMWLGSFSDAQFLEFGLSWRAAYTVKQVLTIVTSFYGSQYHQWPRSTYSPSSSGWDTLHSSAHMVVLAQTRQTTSQLVGTVVPILNENNTFYWPAPTSI